MTVEWSVIFGFSGIIIALTGAVIARDRQLTNMIHTNHDENTKAIKEGDDSLHARINATRDEITKGYVRRDDLDGHLHRIEKSIDELKTDMKDERRETNVRLDALLAALRKT